VSASDGSQWPTDGLTNGLTDGLTDGLTNGLANGLANGLELRAVRAGRTSETTCIAALLLRVNASSAQVLALAWTTPVVDVWKFLLALASADGQQRILVLDDCYGYPRSLLRRLKASTVTPSYSVYMHNVAAAFNNGPCGVPLL